LQEIADAARLAIANDFQLCVHAIGDRANRETLDIFARAFNANPGKRDLRWRIEHAQHLSAPDIPRFRQLGVIASMQGIHATSDAPFVIERLGAERADEGAYVWQRLMQSGAVVSNGTDAPVEDLCVNHVEIGQLAVVVDGTCQTINEYGEPVGRANTCDAPWPSS